jgi:hypothetical protein
MRYHNAMSHESDSAEYQNFTNLLRRIVTVPHAEIQRRMDDDRATKDWTRENQQVQRRQRPIVSPPAPSSTPTPSAPSRRSRPAPSPAAVSSSKTRP